MYKYTIMLIIVITLASTHAYSQDKTVSIGLFDYYPFLLQDSPDKGYAFDLAKAALAEEGYSVTSEFFPLIRAITDTIQLKNDIILGLNPTHTKDIAFSKTSITTLRFMIWSRKDFNWSYDSADRLKEVNIVTVSGFDYTSADKVYQDYISGDPKNVNVLFGENAIQRCFMLVDTKRADIFSLDIDQAAVILGSLGLENKIKSIGELKDFYRGYFGVSRDHPQKQDLLNAFEKGMIKIRKNGKLRSIIDYYKEKYNLKHDPL